MAMGLEQEGDGCRVAVGAAGREEAREEEEEVEDGTRRAEGLRSPQKETEAVVGPEVAGELD